MSAREVHISVINATGIEMQLESKTTLAHGEWASTPTNVPGNGKPVHFQADSDGFATGVEGRIYYSLPNGEICLYFDDPYVGSNGFSGSSSSDSYAVQTIGGSGNSCSVTYIVTNN
ncbi:aegerolysin family protein [Paenibacillus sp. YYML68]|uniref:aegerolysin family protein n=1 Tax=Paenibacillus sp. YYML68 TaxID=2909250 RepID=UPI0024925D56|nr:aegerolysin family protein [Paenibacillus sp. YYML68]